MSHEQERRKVVSEWWGLACEALGDARAAAAQGQVRNGIGRAYYAAFYAAKALLATRDRDAKKHSGVVGLFGETFVVPGLLPAETGRDLHELMRGRIQADYDPKASLTADLLAAYLAQAEDFVSQAERLLREEGWLSE
jgi:uncharacterized protein (UPF0332 family)